MHTKLKAHKFNILPTEHIHVFCKDFRTNPDRGFYVLFLSCKANAKVKLVKTGHGPHSYTLVVICVVQLLFVLLGCYLCCSVIICVARFLFVLFGSYLCCSMYCLCVNVYCRRVTTQLQLTNISI